MTDLERIEEKLNSIEDAINKLGVAFKPILHAEEAAEVLDISIKSLYQLTSARKITHLKPNGKKIYFRRSKLEDFLLRNEIPALYEEQQSNENHWKK